MADYNQRVGGPYGDIFQVGTPYLDKVANQLYTEQRQRELLHQQRQRQLDDEFAKNMAGIRDADVPELTKLYGDWKLANQAAMKKRDGISPQEQLEVLRKKGEVYKKIAESKAGLAEEEDLRKGIQQNPLNYDDNASVYLTNRRRLPLSQLDAYKDEKGVPLNLRDINTYRYKGTDTDFQKILSTAAGTPKQVYQKEEPVGKDNLQFKITPYLYGNTPEQYKESVLSSLSQHKAGRDAEAMISQIDPAIIAEVDKRFRAIPLETWKQMGVDKPQELLLRNAESKAERFANHQAQLYALNNLPKEGTPVFRDNKSAIDARNFAQQKQLKQMEHDFKLMDEVQKNTWLKDYLESAGQKGRTDEFGNKKPMKVYETGVGGVAGNEIPLDPFIAKGLTIGNIIPDKLIVSDVEVKQPDGSFKTERKYVPLYYETDKDGKKTMIKEWSKPVDINSMVVSMGGQVGVKQKNAEGAALMGKTPETKKTTIKKTIKVSEIPAKAAAAGYTEKEYRALLKQNGVTIE